MTDWGERPPGDSVRRGRRARPAVEDIYDAAAADDQRYQQPYEASGYDPYAQPPARRPRATGATRDDLFESSPPYGATGYGPTSSGASGHDSPAYGNRESSEYGRLDSSAYGSSTYDSSAYDSSAYDDPSYGSAAADDAFGAPWSYNPPAGPAASPAEPGWSAGSYRGDASYREQPHLDHPQAAQPYAEPPRTPRRSREIEVARPTPPWYDVRPEPRAHPGSAPEPQPRFDVPPVPTYDPQRFDPPRHDTARHDIGGPNTPRHDVPRHDAPGYDVPGYDTPRRDAPGPYRPVGQADRAPQGEAYRAAEPAAYADPRAPRPAAYEPPSVRDYPHGPPAGAPAAPPTARTFDHSALFRPDPAPGLDLPSRPPVAEPISRTGEPIAPDERPRRQRPPREDRPGRGKAGTSEDLEDAAPRSSRRSSGRAKAAPDDSRTAARAVPVDDYDDAVSPGGALTALPGSLQLRVVLATAGLVCVLASLLSFDQARALSSASDEAVKQELTAVAKTFTNGLVAGGIVEPQDIAEHAQELSMQQRIDSVQVYDVDPSTKNPSVVLVASTSSGSPAAGVRLPRDSRDAWTMLAGYTGYSTGPCTSGAAQKGDICGRAVSASPSGVEAPSVGVVLERNLTEAQEALARRERRAAVGVAGMTGMVGFGLAWMLRHWIFFPLRRLQLVLRSAAAGRPERRLEWRSDDEVGALAAEVDMLADKVRESQRSLSDLALEDALTGLPNRRAGMSQLAAEVAAAQREEKPLAVVVFEAEGLAAIADKWGQDAFEATCRKLGDAVRLSLRPSDVCAHLSSDRFLLVLRGSDARSAHTALDRIREVMTRVRVGPSGGLRLTAGVVESWAGGDPQELVGRAEEELEVSRRRAGATY